MNRDEQRRVEEATLCADADYIPKVPGAGSVSVDASGNRVQLMHNGVRVLADGYYGDFMTQIIQRMKGHHEAQEEKVFYEVLKAIPAGATMIELGSYWAYYSLWFQTVIKGGRNFMIEPAKSSIQCGMKNFALNGLRGDFTQALVGKTSSPDWQQSELKPSMDEVRRVAIRDFVRARHIDEVAILHSDIQGFEFDMLLGCGDLIDAKKIGFFFISTHSVKVHFQCRAHLARKGYTIIAEHTPKESYSEDGLVVASAAAMPPIKISRRPVSLRQKIKAAAFKLFA
jgi:FkbM family methyltransferase